MKVIIRKLTNTDILISFVTYKEIAKFKEFDEINVGAGVGVGKTCLLAIFRLLSQGKRLPYGLMGVLWEYQVRIHECLGEKTQKTPND